MLKKLMIVAFAVLVLAAFSACDDGGGDDPIITKGPDTNLGIEGSACKLDGTCNSGLTCNTVTKICIKLLPIPESAPECTVDADCGAGKLCNSGICEEPIGGGSGGSDSGKIKFTYQAMQSLLSGTTNIKFLKPLLSETIDIMVGSVIENDRIKLVTAKIDASQDQPTGFVGFVVRNPDDSPHPESPDIISNSFKFGNIPYLSKGGLYLKLNSIDLAKKKASLEIFHDVTAFVNLCEDDPKMQENNFNCRRLAEYEKTNGDDSLEIDNIVGFAVPAYKEWLPYGAKTLSVCRKKIGNYLGITPWKEKLYYSIIPATTSSGLGAAIDVIIQKVPEKPYVPPMPPIDQIDYCPNEWAQNHEMVHIFLAGTPIGIGYCNSVGGNNGDAVCLALNEGLAEYIRYVPQVTDKAEDLKCVDKGYTNNGKFHYYYNFSDPSPDDNGIIGYISSACIWQYIEKTYGHDALVSILKHLKSLTNKKGFYNMLDIINDKIGGDITEMLNKRFHITKEMLDVQIPRAYDYPIP